MIVYILIGVVFMFCIEFLLNTNYVKEKITVEGNIGWLERTIGVLFWPICLGIFLYNFFKQLFK
jgi:putative effector of murein hydrolase LrgA (UPF0299 family)